MTVQVPESRRRQGPSPMAGECLRPLTRRQVEDRMPELGDLYARVSGGEPWAWNGARTAFLRRLTSDVRRPGFALLVAEATAPSGTTVLTGCAHGFPVRGDGPWWQGLDGYLPESLLRVAGTGRLFAVSGILVGRRVRTENQARDWNLARRLQKRLLTDHAAAIGVMLVGRGDIETLDALLAWGWRYVGADAAVGVDTAVGAGVAVGADAVIGADAVAGMDTVAGVDVVHTPAVPSFAPCRVLVLR